MSFSQQGRSNTRALKSHYSRPFQFVWGAVVTNDVNNVQLMKGYEPRHEETSVLVSDLVRHKPGCTALEDG